MKTFKYQSIYMYFKHIILCSNIDIFINIIYKYTECTEMKERISVLKIRN